jgi:Concanavalin A-like lectin/glucanases superfamily
MPDDQSPTHGILRHCSRAESRTSSRPPLLAVALGIALASGASAQQRPAGTGEPLSDDILARWSFHQGSMIEVVEERSGRHALVSGTVYLVRGPAGDGVQFDGYTGALHSKSLDALSHATNITIACWLQLEAYPWNDLPLLDQQGSPQDQHGGFFFGLDAEGHLLAHLGNGGDGLAARSAAALPLRTWTLATLTIDPERHLAFTIDGRPSQSQAAAPLAAQDSAADFTAEGAGELLIGHARRPLFPGATAMIHPQLPIEYSLQGSLAGLTVYDRTLSSGEIETLIERADKQLLAPTAWPKFPRGEGSQKAFGAFYTTLRFDPLWDRSRRLGPDSDVVVRFDDASTQLVFWQGNNYVPAWVTENNRWYTDEFMEIYGHPRCPDGEDCEPMSDKQVRYSHVRILENTSARAVVHWRYALSEVEKYSIGDAPTPRDWGDWADEYWTVYPDGIAVRRSVLWSTAAERDKTEFQESIVLIPPGETPEDSVNFDALTFANLEGASNTYRWQPKVGKGLALPHGPEKFSDPKDAVIQWVNLKSEWKPFQVAWGEDVKFAAYNGENSISSFEWWNHWPVAQIASSGRPALAADRAGHTSLSHIYWPIYEQDEQTISKILLTGLTRSSASQLAPIAASWRNPPRLELSDGTVAPYDAAQRAYVLPPSGAQTRRMTMHASAASPAVHPSFVVPGWRSPGEMRVVSGADLSVRARIGQVEDLKGSTLIVYLPITATDDVVLELKAK